MHGIVHATYGNGYSYNVVVLFTRACYIFRCFVMLMGSWERILKYYFLQ